MVLLKLMQMFGWTMHGVEVLIYSKRPGCFLNGTKSSPCFGLKKIQGVAMMYLTIWMTMADWKSLMVFSRGHQKSAVADAASGLIHHRSITPTHPLPQRAFAG